MIYRKLLVLGASGGCGRWVVRMAKERGHQVTAIVRPESYLERSEGVNVGVPSASVRNQPILRANIARTGPIRLYFVHNSTASTFRDAREAVSNTFRVPSGNQTD